MFLDLENDEFELDEIEEPETKPEAKEQTPPSEPMELETEVKPEEPTGEQQPEQPPEKPKKEAWVEEVEETKREIAALRAQNKTLADIVAGANRIQRQEPPPAEQPAPTTPEPINIDASVWGENPNQAAQIIYEKAKRDSMAEFNRLRETERLEQQRQQQAFYQSYSANAQAAVEAFGEILPDIGVQGSQNFQLWHETLIKTGLNRDPNGPMKAAAKLVRERVAPPQPSTPPPAQVNPGIAEQSRQERVRRQAMEPPRQRQQAPTNTLNDFPDMTEADKREYRASLKGTGLTETDLVKFLKQQGRG